MDWIDNKSLATGLIGFLAGGIISWASRNLLESRRQIRSTFSDLYFGPMLTYNHFMGRNYPDDDNIALEFNVKFFSEKTQKVGLHEFAVELCKKKRLGYTPEFTFSELTRDFNNKDTPFSVDTLELEPRTWLSMQICCRLAREEWEEQFQKIKECKIARLTCKTSEGKLKRFIIGSIEFPKMPPHGLRGIEFMSVNIMPETANLQSSRLIPDRLLIQASRRHPGIQQDIRHLNPEDARFWNGHGWIVSKNEAKIYKDIKEAREDGGNIRIWNIVPDEWL